MKIYIWHYSRFSLIPVAQINDILYSFNYPKNKSPEGEDSLSDEKRTVYLSGGEVAPAGINMLDFILFV
jgi:hypothetical protein